MKKFTTIPKEISAVMFEDSPEVLSEIAKMCNVDSVIATPFMGDRFIMVGSSKGKIIFDVIITEGQFIMSDLSIRTAWELKVHFIEVKE
jgi:hypothetical protein